MSVTGFGLCHTVVFARRFLTRTITISLLRYDMIINEGHRINKLLKGIIVSDTNFDRIVKFADHENPLFGARIGA